MPKQTFENLPESKKQRLIASGIALFAQKPFSQVSIAEILRQSHLPRTSFYDYFDNKEDFYLMLIDQISKTKQKFYGHYIEALTQGDFFSKISAYFEAGYAFASQEPLYENILRYAFEEPQILIKVYGEAFLDTSSHYKLLLEEAIIKGEVRADIDVDFVAQTISILTSEWMKLSLSQKDKALSQSIDYFSKSIISLLQEGIA